MTAYLFKFPISQLFQCAIIFEVTHTKNNYLDRLYSNIHKSFVFSTQKAHFLKFVMRQNSRSLHSVKIIKPHLNSLNIDDSYGEDESDPFLLSSSYSDLDEDLNQKREFSLYKCLKKCVFKNFKKLIIFDLIDQQGKIIYSSKFRKTQSSPSIPLFHGNEPNMKHKNAQGIILTSNHMSSFSLRKASRYGNELMSIKFTKNKNKQNNRVNKAPRSLKVIINDNASQKPLFLKNKAPKRTIFGTWELDLNSDKVLPSSKNSRVINNDNELMFITRKTKKHVLEIEASSIISPLQIFALSIAFHVCQMK